MQARVGPVLALVAAIATAISGCCSPRGRAVVPWGLPHAYTMRAALPLAMPPPASRCPPFAPVNGTLRPAVPATFMPADEVLYSSGIVEVNPYR